MCKERERKIAFQEHPMRGQRDLLAFPRYLVKGPDHLLVPGGPVLAHK